MFIGILKTRSLVPFNLMVMSVTHHLEDTCSNRLDGLVGEHGHHLGFQKETLVHFFSLIIGLLIK